MESDDHNDHEETEVGHVIRHFCKVCNKGFGCAGALGGHMRAHVVGDVCNDIVVDDGVGTVKPEGGKHSYFLRAKTPRYIGYNSSDQEDGPEYKKASLPLPPPAFNRLCMSKERLPPGSKLEYVHENSPSREEEDLANCLVMLSNKSCYPKGESKGKEVVDRGLFQCKACKKIFSSHQALGGHRASHKKVKGCFAAKADGDGLIEEDEDLNQEDIDHRAPSESDATRLISTRKQPHKMHECSVCRRVFSSGQALGGHKRCHWLTTSADNTFIPNFHDFQYDHRQNQQQQQQQQQQQFFRNPMLTTNLNQNNHSEDNQLDLNLNLHAPQQHDRHSHHTHNTAKDSDKTSMHEASTTLYLQQLAGGGTGKIENDSIERGREVKLRKLSDLRDVNLDGGWLQMGIASTTNIC